jgi:predicted SprT family Zn-dependent metalloprotease
MTPNFTPIDDNDPVMQELERETKVKQLAYELLANHGLEDWFFEFHDAVHRVGQCNHTTKTIAYSRPFINSSWDSITDVLLHEIAHALVGPEVKAHGWEWKSMARRIGANPSHVTETVTSTAKPNFYLRCSNCGRRWYRFRLKRHMIGRKSSCCRAPLEGYRIKKGE